MSTITNRIVFLSVLSAIGVISASLCAPALPYIANHFQAHIFHIQFTISLFLVGNALGQFFSGPLSDKFGQKMILLAGLVIYIVASLCCAIANQMPFLLTARFFQGMGSAVGPVLARAIIVNTFPKDKSAQIQSYTALGIGFASMFAIFASGYLTLISWRQNFLLAAFLGVVLFFWSAYTLKNLELKSTSFLSLKNSFFEMVRVFVKRPFLVPALTHTLTYGLMYGYIGLFPFILIELFHKKDAAMVGTLSAYMIAAYMLGAFFTARFAVFVDSRRLVRIGILIQLLSGALLYFSQAPLLILSALAIFNLSIGIILPLTASQSLALFAGKSAGAASSALGLTYRFLGALLSTLICLIPLRGSLGIAIVVLSLIASVLMLKNPSTTNSEVENA